MDGLSLRILNNDYVVKYPTVGQFIDIKVQENIISKGQLTDLIFIGTSMTQEADAAIAIKTLAFFLVCVPEMIKDLKVKSIRDLDMIDFLELRKVYIREIAPWLNEWQEKLQSIMKEDVEESNA